MKHVSFYIKIIMLMIISANAVAATSAVLIIKAETVPPACTAILSDGGEINFGTISAGQLSESQSVALAPKRIQLTISCDSAAKLNVTFDDNRRDSSDDVASHYGLGKALNDAKIGYYTLTAPSVAAGSQQASLLSSTDTVNWTTESSDANIENNNTGMLRHYSIGSSGIPVGANSFNFDIEVTPTISPEMRNITEATQLDGSTTINIDYL
ncbi:DUF1120 domain-containing protein [Buttiauxella sp.]|uniref:DUF1120 domain-containing protein n=1 Tax=Buttiauxella sp. TaxID=1972222 RepID=UPI003C71A1BE